MVCIQIQRTDQVTEYEPGEINSFLNKNRIEHIVTERPGHAQMIVTERMNPTITETARTLLIDAGLPKFWWGHSAIYVTTIINRCTP